MNDNLSRAGKTILIIIIVVGVLSIVTNRSEPQIIYIEEINIPSVHDIQRRLKALNDPRYDPGKIDGIIGSKSRTAWDNYTCDQFAIRAIEGNKNDKGRILQVNKASR